MMANIAFITKYYHLSFDEIMNMPYAIFLSYLKWARIFEMQKTEEGQKELAKMELLKRSEGQVEPDLNRIRGLTGYKKG